MVIDADRPKINMEELINQVQGVLSSRVIEQDQEIIEIHVLADTTRGPKQVVRDIESAILVKTGRPIDYKRISIAQLGEEQRHLLEGPRLKLLEICSTTGWNKLTVAITIGLGNEQFKATRSGPNIIKNRLRLPSLATIAAIEDCYGAPSRLEIDRVEKILISGHAAVLAAVSLILKSGEETLLGTALIKEDIQEASARAVLDALNRRLSIIDNVSEIETGLPKNTNNDERKT